MGYILLNIAEHFKCDLCLTNPFRNKTSKYNSSGIAAWLQRASEMDTSKGPCFELLLWRSLAHNHIQLSAAHELYYKHFKISSFLDRYPFLWDTKHCQCPGLLAMLYSLLVYRQTSCSHQSGKAAGIVWKAQLGMLFPSDSCQWILSSFSCVERGFLFI